MSILRVGVLMGGRGNEKEVSFNSGRTICDHLDTMRYHIVPLFQTAQGSLFILPWRFLHRGKISDFEHRLETEAIKVAWDDLKQHVDFIYIAMHGYLAEDGSLQGFLEVLGIPYLGSKVMASAVGMDKVFHKDLLSSHGFTVPKGIIVRPHELIEYEKQPDLLFKKIKEKNIPFPLVVKPSNEGSSIGVDVIFEEKNLITSLVKARELCAHEHPQRAVTFLIEERIEGMEFTCISITDYRTGKRIPLPPTEIVHESNTHFFDYEQKYMPGRSIKFTPARCSKELIETIQETCLKVTEVLDIENISRIDGIVTADNIIVIIDPNTLCGMAPSSFLFRQAAEIDMSHTALINHLIETELARYGMLEKIEHTEAQTKKTMNTIQKTKVAILMGGRSHEKEISLESGRNVFYKLSLQKYEPIALFVDDSLHLYQIDQNALVRNSTKEIVSGLSTQIRVNWNDLPKLVDFVFIALHGGEGENGSVQGTLEMLGIPYNGSSILASALCMDKYKTTQFLQSKGFDVPQGMLIEKNDWYTQQQDMLALIKKMSPFPLIVKPHDDGCSVLVQKAKNETELIKALGTLYAAGKQHALIEECIMGIELTVGVIGNTKPRALPPSQAVTTHDILSIEEKFLPGAGENQTPAPLPQPTISFIQKTIEDVYEALGCKGYSRIDCFYQSANVSPTKQDRLIIIECNTLPGLTPATCIFHQAAEIGLKPMEFIDLIVELGFEQHGNSNNIKQLQSYSDSSVKISQEIVHI